VVVTPGRRKLDVPTHDFFEPACQENELDQPAQRQKSTTDFMSSLFSLTLSHGPERDRGPFGPLEKSPLDMEFYE
jgi:hypothetical protein